MVEKAVSQLNALRKKSIIKLAIALGVCVAISLLVFLLFYQIKKTNLGLLQDNTLHATHSIFSRELGDVRKVVKLLVADQSLKRNDVSTVSAEQIRYLNNVLNHFTDFGLAAGTISQIRWLDIQGQERLRVNFKAGIAEVVPEQQLQNKRNRYYFTEGMQLKNNNIYISPIDLNVEFGEVVTPFQPTLRASFRTLPDDYLLDGLIVVNFDLSSTLNHIKELGSAKAQVQLINGEGYWLLHPNKAMEWGFMLAQPDLSLKKNDPALWNTMISAASSKQLVISKSMSASFLKMNLGNANSQPVENDIFMLVSASDGVVDAVFIQSLVTALVFGLLLVALSIYYQLRSFRYQSKIIQTSINLEIEQQELLTANTKLQRYIKQQHELQGELIEAKRLSSLGLMVAGVAHEMNTPLGGAAISLSNAEMINQKLQKQIEQGLTKEFLETSIEGIDVNLKLSKVNLDKAICHVKSFKEMAHDRTNDNHIKCDINKVIEDLLLGLKSRLKTFNVTVQTDIEINREIVTRPGVISQIIESLIVNAISHAFTEQDNKLIVVRVFEEKYNSLCITLSDNGVGIDDSLRSNLFEPFVTTSRKHGHTGLGLYLVYQWVTEILGGRISLISRHDLPANIATQFKITIPLKAQETVVK